MPQENPMRSFHDVWRFFTENAAQLLNLSETSVRLWIQPISARAMVGNRMELTVRSDYLKERIEQDYLDRIRQAMEEIFGHAVEVELYVDTRTYEPAEEEQPLPRPIDFISEEEEKRICQTWPDSMTDYTFDNFIVGSSNKLAHAASMAAAAHPGREDYNPLFIYGDSGLGKTHLLYAVRNEIAKRYADKVVLYVRAEDFINEMIFAIQHNQQAKFKEKYRQHVDVFLMDDVQFLANKEGLQEEMFHTFNTLYENHAQIILTSDRPPKEINNLDARLLSRFEWGIVADVAAPDFELRMAIILAKAEEVHLQLPRELAEYIAERIKTNIRQLEGVVKKLKALYYLTGEKPTLALTQTAIKDIMYDERPTAVTIQRIVDEVCRYYSLTAEDLRGRKKTAPIVNARHVAMYLLREVSSLSLPSIGLELGGKDHSSVIHALNKVREKMEEDPQFASQVNDLKKNITYKR